MARRSPPAGLLANELAGRLGLPAVAIDEMRRAGLITPDAAGRFNPATVLAAMVDQLAGHARALEERASVFVALVQRMPGTLEKALTPLAALAGSANVPDEVRPLIRKAVCEAFDRHTAAVAQVTAEALAAAETSSANQIIGGFH